MSSALVDSSSSSDLSDLNSSVSLMFGHLVSSIALTATPDTSIADTCFNTAVPSSSPCGGLCPKCLGANACSSDSDCVWGTCTDSVCEVSPETFSSVKLKIAMPTPNVVNSPVTYTLYAATASPIKKFGYIRFNTLMNFSSLETNCVKDNGSYATANVIHGFSVVSLNEALMYRPMKITCTMFSPSYNAKPYVTKMSLYENNSLRALGTASNIETTNGYAFNLTMGLYARQLLDVPTYFTFTLQGIASETIENPVLKFSLDYYTNMVCFSSHSKVEVKTVLDPQDYKVHWAYLDPLNTTQSAYQCNFTTPSVAGDGYTYNTTVTTPSTRDKTQVLAEHFGMFFSFTDSTNMASITVSFKGRLLSENEMLYFRYKVCALWDFPEDYIGTIILFSHTITNGVVTIVTIAPDIMVADPSDEVVRFFLDRLNHHLAKAMSAPSTMKDIILGIMVAKNTCFNNRRDGDESDVDCGGLSGCPVCPAFNHCFAHSDCQSNVCSVSQGWRCAEVDNSPFYSSVVMRPEISEADVPIKYSFEFVSIPDFIPFGFVNFIDAPIEYPFDPNLSCRDNDNEDGENTNWYLSVTSRSFIVDFTYPFTHVESYMYCTVKSSPGNGVASLLYVEVMNSLLGHVFAMDFVQSHATVNSLNSIKVEVEQVSSPFSEMKIVLTPRSLSPLPKNTTAIIFNPRFNSETSCVDYDGTNLFVKVDYTLLKYDATTYIISMNRDIGFHELPITCTFHTDDGNSGRDRTLVASIVSVKSEKEKSIFAQGVDTQAEIGEYIRVRRVSIVTKLNVTMTQDTHINTSNTNIAGIVNMSGFRPYALDFLVNSVNDLFMGANETIVIAQQTVDAENNQITIIAYVMDKDIVQQQQFHSKMRYQKLQQQKENSQFEPTTRASEDLDAQPRPELNHHRLPSREEDPELHRAIDERRAARRASPRVKKPEALHQKRVSKQRLFSTSENVNTVHVIKTDFDVKPTQKLATSTASLQSSTKRSSTKPKSGFQTMAADAKLDPTADSIGLSPTWYVINRKEQLLLHLLPSLSSISLSSAMGSVPASCFNGVLDEDETDIDCGGVFTGCRACQPAQNCYSNIDCLYNKCILVGSQYKCASRDNTPFHTTGMMPDSIFTPNSPTVFTIYSYAVPETSKVLVSFDYSMSGMTGNIDGTNCVDQYQPDNSGITFLSSESQGRIMINRPITGQTRTIICTLKTPSTTWRTVPVTTVMRSSPSQGTIDMESKSNILASTNAMFTSILNRFSVSLSASRQVISNQTMTMNIEIYTLEYSSNEMNIEFDLGYIPFSIACRDDGHTKLKSTTIGTKYFIEYERELSPLLPNTIFCTFTTSPESTPMRDLLVEIKNAATSALLGSSSVNLPTVTVLGDNESANNNELYVRGRLKNKNAYVINFGIYTQPERLLSALHFDLTDTGLVNPFCTSDIIKSAEYSVEYNSTISQHVNITMLYPSGSLDCTFGATGVVLGSKLNIIHNTTSAVNGIQVERILNTNLHTITV